MIIVMVVVAVIAASTGIWILFGGAPQMQQKREVKLVVITRLALRRGMLLGRSFLRAS